MLRFVLFALPYLAHGIEKPSLQPPDGSVGICWTRNEVALEKTEEELASTDLYRLSEAARSAQLAAPDVKRCVFTNLSPPRLRTAMAAAVGEQSAATLFHVILPTSNVSNAHDLPRYVRDAATTLDRVRAIARMEASFDHSNLPRSARRVPAALVLFDTLASRIGRLANLLRAPFETTLFLDDDTFLCPQPAAEVGSMAQWVRALFDHKNAPDVRIANYHLSRGWLLPTDHQSETLHSHAECIARRCARVCGVAQHGAAQHGAAQRGADPGGAAQSRAVPHSATPECFACKLGCPDSQGGNSGRVRIPGFRSYYAQGGVIAIHAVGASGPHRSAYESTSGRGSSGGTAVGGGGRDVGGAGSRLKAVRSGSDLTSATQLEAIGPSTPEVAPGVFNFVIDWMSSLLRRSRLPDGDMWTDFISVAEKQCFNQSVSDVREQSVQAGGGSGVSMFRRKCDHNRLRPLLKFVTFETSYFAEDQSALHDLIICALAADVGCSSRSGDVYSANCEAASRVNCSGLSLKWTFGELITSFNFRSSAASPEHGLAQYGVQKHGLGANDFGIFFQANQQPASPIWGPVHVVHDRYLFINAVKNHLSKGMGAFRERMRQHVSHMCFCANKDVLTEPWRLVHKTVLANMKPLQTMEPPKTCTEYSKVLRTVPLRGARNTDEWTAFVQRVSLNQSNTSK